MKIKLLEVRDKATFIPVFAFRARPDKYFNWETVKEEDPQRYLLSRSGFGIQGDGPCVILGRLECAGVSRNCTYDPFSWNDRTFTTAHRYITDHFDELKDGDVIDVEFILKETTTKKKSEKYE